MIVVGFFPKVNIAADQNDYEEKEEGNPVFLRLRRQDQEVDRFRIDKVGSFYCFHFLVLIPIHFSQVHSKSSIFSTVKRKDFNQTSLQCSPLLSYSFGSPDTEFAPPLHSLGSNSSLMACL